MTSWWVLHVDIDQFGVAVEVLHSPELAGKPVAVWASPQGPDSHGDPRRRAVVAAASYEARELGVRAGMPLSSAVRKLPDGVYLPADIRRNAAMSARLMATLRTFPVVVEVLGWEEAYVGAETDDPETLARDIRQAVLERTELHCAVGIGTNRLQAKVATGFAKAGGGVNAAGVFRLTGDNWFAELGDRATDALHGIGGKTAKKLAAVGLTTVRELADADPDELAGRFGPKLGPSYRRLARGEAGSEVVTTPAPPLSFGRETTFPEDESDLAAISEQVVLLARQMAGAVVREGRPGVRVAIKLRFVPFTTQTRSVALDPPTTDAAAIEAAALEALGRFDSDLPVRLVGVRVDLSDP